MRRKSYEDARPLVVSGALTCRISSPSWQTATHSESARRDADRRPGYFRETASDQVMEKVDAEGKVLGFSVLKVSALKEKPLEVAL